LPNSVFYKIGIMIGNMNNPCIFKTNRPSAYQNGLVEQADTMPEIGLDDSGQQVRVITNVLPHLGNSALTTSILTLPSKNILTVSRVDALLLFQIKTLHIYIILYEL
jgi:hypothetical protein